MVLLKLFQEEHTCGVAQDTLLLVLSVLRDNSSGSGE